MESEGLIRRIDRHDAKGGQQTNFYSFDGLIEIMLPHAKANIDQRKAHEADKISLRRKKRIKPGQPKLEVVPGGKHK